MTTALAWLALPASVTLAGLLTVILLPWALWTARRSLALSAMTLAMLAMTWRDEAWKTVFLQSEQRVSELQRQLPQPISSNIESSNLGIVLLCAVSHRRESELNLDHLPPVRLLSSRDDVIHEEPPEYMCDSDSLLRTLQAPHPRIAGNESGSAGSRLDLIRLVYKSHMQSEATPLYFI
jgi:hypothetical protein